MIEFQKFQALGDGNCLYNTEAVWLIYAYQQGLLEPLFDNKNILFNFAVLFAIVEDPEIFDPKKELTKEQIKQAFDKLILHCTSNDEINWIKLQKILAYALRNIVIDAIKNHPFIKEQAISNLTLYIDNMINDVHKVNNEIVELRMLYLDVLTQLNAYQHPELNTVLNTSDETHNFVITEYDQLIANLLKYSSVKSVPLVGKVNDELTRLVASTLNNTQNKEVLDFREDALKALKSFLSKTIQADFDNFALPIPAHFEGMPTIKEKILSIFRDPDLRSNEDFHKAFKGWFFEGDAKGFNDYLKGINGIGISGVNAGELEQKVLSVLFHHGINTRSVDFLNEHNRRAIDGFNAEEQAKHQPERKLIFDMQKLPGHWNALLPNDEKAKDIVHLNETQRTIYEDEKTKSANKNVLEQGLLRYGSYPAHHVAELNFLEITQYCALFGISLKEYNDSVKEVPPENPPEAPNQNPSEIPNQNPPEVPVQDPAEIPNPPVQIPRPDPPKAAGPERDWFNFLTMAWTFAAALAIFTYAVIWPFWFPMMTALFVNTALAPFTYAFSMSIASVFCIGISALFTEKIHADWENDQSLNNQNLHPTENEEPSENPKTFLSKFINKQAFKAQQNKQENSEKPWVSIKYN